jgi:ABC-2 type transport system ATP-binding protein
MNTNELSRTSAATSTRRDDAIRVDGLSKVYGSRRAVDGLTFSVRRGTICGFIGPNGSGKTTTIRMLLGLIAPTDGTATVLGHSISEPVAYLAKVGAMIEGPAFYPTLSARANLHVLAALGSIEHSRIDEVLAIVGLTDRANDHFRSFSLGMKQRLGIAAALLPRPELLLLDEPTNGLDPPGIREVRNLMRSLADAGTTVLVSSHLLDELQQVCDDVVIIRAGMLLFSGAVDELVASQQSVLTAQPERSGDLHRLAALIAGAGRSTEIVGDRIKVTAPPTWAAELNRTAMDAGIILIELGAASQSLEDIFFELTDQPTEKNQP